MYSVLPNELNACMGHSLGNLSILIDDKLQQGLLLGVQHSYLHTFCRNWRDTSASVIYGLQDAAWLGWMHSRKKQNVCFSCRAGSK